MYGDFAKEDTEPHFSLVLFVFLVLNRISDDFLITFAYLEKKQSNSFHITFLPSLQGRYCEELGIDANHVARMFFFNGLATAIFRAFTGYLCDVKRQYRIWILRFTVFVSGVIVLLMTVWTTYKQLLACFIAYGVMDGALSSSINVLVLSTLSLKQKSQGFGFFHLCVATNLAAGPALAGTILSRGKETGEKRERDRRGEERNGKARGIEMGKN